MSKGHEVHKIVASAISAVQKHDKSRRQIEREAVAQILQLFQAPEEEK